MQAYSNIFSFKGRISRGMYALTVIPAIFINIVLNISSRYVTDSNVVIVVLVLSLLMLYLLFAATVKRARDIGKSSLLAVLLIIPLIGFFVILYLLFANTKVDESEIDSDDNQNKKYTIIP